MQSSPCILLLPDGAARLYWDRVTAGQVQQEYPEFVVCEESDPVNPLQRSAVVQPGSTCFLVPSSQRNRRTQHVLSSPRQLNGPTTLQPANEEPFSTILRLASSGDFRESGVTGLVVNCK
ncbi:hypothetical protein CLOM_g14509 [Closterium sp. NIES-68]|nr:hypothetical protein CLOM_g14509 [Closterium sp. NIES-68]